MSRIPLIIFGSSELAEVAHFYFTRDSDYEVHAFIVDEEFKTNDSLLGLPIVGLAQASELYPAREYFAFVALGYSNVNNTRREKYYRLKELGYRLASYISSSATVLSEEIGDNAFILEDNTVQPFVRIGNNVTLWSGNHVGHHSVIADHVFVSSHVVISGGVTVGEQCFLGVNSTLRDHIVIGEKSIIGAGALIMKNAEPEGLYVSKATPRSIHSSLSI